MWYFLRNEALGCLRMTNAEKCIVVRGGRESIAIEQRFVCATMASDTVRSKSKIGV